MHTSVRLLGRVLLLPVAALLFGGLLTACHPAGPGGSVSAGDSSLFYNALDGTNSRMTIRFRDGALFVHDGAGLTAGANCVQLDDHRVSCNAFNIFSLMLSMGDGDDSVTNVTNFTAFIFGGPGNDTINGGTADDHINGGPGNDTLTGGAGLDELIDGSTDADADTFSGGADADTMTYAGADSGGTGVTVTLNDLANDGLPGENDNVASDIEFLLGTSSSDNLTGNDNANGIAGGDGNDVLFGLGGDDELLGEGGFSDIGDGGAGNDFCDVEAEFNCEV